MRFTFRSMAGSDDRVFELGLLVIATGLVLTMQNPVAVDSASRLLSELELPSPARVLEWRPDGPPPWVDGDQMPTEEAEDLPAVTAVSRDPESLSDPRERPRR